MDCSVEIRKTGKRIGHCLHGNNDLNQTALVALKELRTGVHLAHLPSAVLQTPYW